MATKKYPRPYTVHLSAAELAAIRLALKIQLERPNASDGVLTKSYLDAVQAIDNYEVKQND